MPDTEKPQLQLYGVSCKSVEGPGWAINVLAPDIVAALKGACEHHPHHQGDAIVIMWLPYISVDSQTLN